VISLRPPTIASAPLVAAVLKRSFDVSVALAALMVVSPLLLLIALAVMIDSPGPVIFRQRRIGRDFEPFEIYKFRTMHAVSGPSITTSVDHRITRTGRLLRKAKLDELPQLVNVLKGDMSLVGPRPEVPGYVSLYEPDYRRILSVRPGLTDFASLKYRDEASLLAASADPEQEYVNRILPDKIQLAVRYVDSSSLFLDMALIAKTVVRLFGRCVKV